MIDIKNIYSLTDFNRNSRTHLKRLRKSGLPEVLTVNGRAEVIVQDARAYQELLDTLDYVDSVKTIRSRLASMHEGKEGVPLDEAFERIRTRLGAKNQQ